MSIKRPFSRHRDGDLRTGSGPGRREEWPQRTERIPEHLGAMISVVNGMLLARRFKGITDTVGVASVGDGGTSTGAFHEALNQAAVEKLPLVLVIANNQYAYSTPNHRQFACRTLLDKAIGYGIEGVEVDGTDLPACLNTVGAAVARARAGNGPQLVVATLLRLCGHGEHDDGSYIDPGLKTTPTGRDCLMVSHEMLLREGWADAAAIAAWREEMPHSHIFVNARLLRGLIFPQVSDTSKPGEAWEELPTC